MGVGRGLVTKVNASAETWIGDPAVQQVALAGATPSADQLGAAVSAAREQWYKTVVDPSGPPMLHIPPKMITQASGARLVTVLPGGEVFDAWGQPVVMSPGYDVATPHMFFTPKPVVHLASVSDEGGELFKAQINQKDIFLNRPAAIDIRRARSSGSVPDAAERDRAVRPAPDSGPEAAAH